MLGFIVPLALLALLVLGSLSKDLLEVALGPKGTEALALYLVCMCVRACVHAHLMGIGAASAT